MYTVTIPNPAKGKEAIILRTLDRHLARAAMALGKENNLEVKVTEEREPRVVKFKNL